MRLCCLTCFLFSQVQQSAKVQLGHCVIMQTEARLAKPHGRLTEGRPRRPPPRKCFRASEMARKAPTGRVPPQFHHVPDLRSMPHRSRTRVQTPKSTGLTTWNFSRLESPPDAERTFRFPSTITTRSGRKHQCWDEQEPPRMKRIGPWAPASSGC